MCYSLGKKKRYGVNTQLMVKNPEIIVHKAGHKKIRMHEYDIYKENHPATSKQVVKVFDLILERRKRFTRAKIFSVL
ncbi:MAG: hypothetical protein M3Z01_03515 [Thermoproteota archaeon]|nr:hypothetical protein [Thermoproteota archaeon]